LYKLKVYFILAMYTFACMYRFTRNNRDLLATGIHNWNEGGARRFLARALNSRRRGQRRPMSRNAIMSHISQLPPALFLSSLLGTSVSDGMDYEVNTYIHTSIHTVFSLMWPDCLNGRNIVISH